MMDQMTAPATLATLPELGVAELTPAEKSRAAGIVYEVDAVLRPALDRVESDGEAVLMLGPERSAARRMIAGPIRTIRAASVGRC
jgi:hypothetical protein